MLWLALRLPLLPLEVFPQQPSPSATIARERIVACDPLAMATANAAVVALSGNELRVGKARFWIPADSLPKARALVAQLERAP